MSVIVSRAIPEIDGFKPSHRKLLYTMYKMGLLTGSRTKSANIVGQTMRLNPHGDAAIYDTMVRLSRGNESLLHPFVDSKGNFGKVYSRDMAESWQLLCDQVGIECVTVAGSRQGENYWWNIITLDGRCCHVDILSDVLDGGTLHTKSDSEMTDYYWDTAKYPACPAPPAAVQQTPAADTAAGTGTDAATPAEPTPETPADGETPAPTEPGTEGTS